MVQLSPTIKDWLQAAAWVAAGIGAILTAIKLWSELRQGREQRARDLRWKQAEAGKSLNDEMLTDSEAWSAMQMLDYDGLEFELPSNNRIPIYQADVKFALNPDNDVTDDKHVYIRECFDSLFYYMAMFEHYGKTTLIVPEDVEFPIDYYMRLLAGYRDVVDAYVRRYGLKRTEFFLAAHPAWQNAPAGAATSRKT
jgi:hypothetical protein